jgi:hypothetical protein
MTQNSVPSRRMLPVLCIAVAFGIMLPAALADVTPPATASQSTPARKPLEAGTQVVVLTLSNLREVGTDLKHLQSAATHLYDEVTIQQVTLQTQPELINPGLVINIPVGTIPTGVILDAKPKRVEAAMAEIRPIATLLKSDVDEFVSGEKQLQMPGATQEEMEQRLRQWAVSVNNIYAQLEVLEPLTKTAPYNQPGIAQATWAIVQDAKELDKMRRVLYKSLQREGKRQEQSGSVPKKHWW